MNEEVDTATNLFNYMINLLTISLLVNSLAYFKRLKAEHYMKNESIEDS